MHTVTLRLKLTKYDRYLMEKRFYALSHIHNVLVKHVRKLLKHLEHDKAYQDALKEYVELGKLKNLKKPQKQRKSELGKLLSDIRKELGLSETALQSHIKLCHKRYNKCLSSQQVQKEASRVWQSVDKYLFKDGKEVHFKKYRDFDTIGGKSNTNGAKFDQDKMLVNWIGMAFPCILPKKDKNIDYVMESLDSKVSYCEIERKMFPNGWHYYVIIYLQEKAPCRVQTEANQDNVTGVDIGTSSVATVSDTMVTLKELAPDSTKYNKRIQKLLEKMDRSRRATNPNKYKPDGTIDKSNHDKWKNSKTYLRDRDKLKALYRQKSAYVKQSHEHMCNLLLQDSVNFIVEDMSFKGLQARSKKTERQDKVSTITNKDGTVRQIRKYKRKKRFGKSMNNRSPASFIQILKTKAQQYGGQLLKVETKEFRASQYDHSTDQYKKVPLSQRDKVIEGHNVQRDLYSAYLLKNSDDSLTHTDREKCIYGFDQFLKLHDELITEMKQQNISMKQCFGF